MGPLTGVRVVEFAGIGPGPFACMMLADMGAEVVRIDRALPEGATAPDPTGDLISRGRKSVALNLKDPEDVATALALVQKADILIEGFRPGVMERLGLGPDVCLKWNPRLVYGRMTGWGQDGPLSHAAGHDINYISLSGALWSMGEEGRKPMPPLNLLGDFGAGGMYLAFGVVSALFRARESGKGDVVDAAICDGAASLFGFIQGMHNRGNWTYERAANRLDGGAPFYGVFECADGLWVSIAPLEPQFYALFLKLLELNAEEFKDRLDRASWPRQQALFEEIFASKPRAHWCDLFEGTDICFAPVLTPDEALSHPHNVARGIYDHSHGFPQPAPAPRFREAVAELPTPAPRIGEHTQSVLKDWGVS